ncbi:hypothetical protein FraQA3DRAFT_2285 [Frankia sp. QA3]|nr:hypothetical protein FraQA3DRAFT_2285 [Frankia sp. QA3]
MGRSPIDDDPVHAKMLPPTDRGTLIRESVSVLAWCLVPGTDGGSLRAGLPADLNRWSRSAGRSAARVPAVVAGRLDSSMTCSPAPTPSSTARSSTGSTPSSPLVIQLRRRLLALSRGGRAYAIAHLRATSPNDTR